jgi:ribose transport system substrate-binding protein
MPTVTVRLKSSFDSFTLFYYIQSLLMLWVVGISFITFGCGSDGTSEKPADTDDPDDTGNPDTGDGTEGVDWVVRAQSPDSPFKPDDIEGIADDIATALNRTTQDPEMSFAFITKDFDIYFEMSVMGANRAMSELGVLGTVAAPVDDEDTEGLTPQELQLSIFDDQVAAGVKGIGLAAMNPDMSTSIDAAVDQNIVVITFDSDAAESKRQLYIGTINAEAGKTAGQSMVDLLAGATGTVVVLGYDSEAWLDGYNRTHAASDVIEAAGNTVVIRHTNWSDQMENETFIMDTLMTADPPAVGCLGVFSNSYLCASAADKAGVDIKIAAFDFDPVTLDYMEQGRIQVTHGQRIYYMGYLIPYLLYAVNSLGLDETKSLIGDLMPDDYRVDLGLDVIPADGVADYNAFLEGLGTL